MDLPLSQSSESTDDSMDMKPYSTSSSNGMIIMTGPGRKRRNNRVEMNDDEYKRRRERNNEAVRKCRIKSRQKSKEMAEKVTLLREENAILNQKVIILTKELSLLKELFLTHAKGSTKSSINNIINQKQSLKSQNLSQLCLPHVPASSDHQYVKSESMTVLEEDVSDDDNNDPIVDLSVRRPGIVVEREQN